MADAIALGKLLIDFVPTVSGVTLLEAPGFQKAPGRVPANVVVGLARLGISAGFMGQVGDDAFGHFLAITLRDNQVDVLALRFSSTAYTALDFVSLKADGERDFMFYRHPSADMLYQASDVDDDYFRRGGRSDGASLQLCSRSRLALDISRPPGTDMRRSPYLHPKETSQWLM